ncbi:protein pelota [Babesia microti strain RI]|uniref:Protein pelota n=1 Tax=Babesia microti (strain RI) TaxID=1133968 RepID=A0A0K3AR07_BABMR|nr:protein pelota [Babesia microti strain RI]CTQ41063.1 protein pelota [Babesia microti strain RI]|eukprot:XP_012649074.1 protein pelota [Babesia microti strain RI]
MTWHMALIALGGCAFVARMVYRSFNKFPSGKIPMGFEPKMSYSEAINILNISGAPTKDKIRQFHRNLMLKNHPDNGGSTYLASKVNEAKDFLIK